MNFKLPFSTNRNNLIYEIFYNYSELWHVITHFDQIIFHGPIYYEVERKFCLSICKLVCVLANVQTKRPTASKFDTEILERVFEKASKRFFLNRSKFFRMI